jgi:hypothetical protein
MLRDASCLRTERPKKSAPAGDDDDDYDDDKGSHMQGYYH